MKFFKFPGCKGLWNCELWYLRKNSTKQKSFSSVLPLFSYTGLVVKDLCSLINKVTLWQVYISDSSGRDIFKYYTVPHPSQSLCSFNFSGRPHCQERAGAVTFFNIYCIIHLPPCLLSFLWGGRMKIGGFCLKTRKTSIKKEKAQEPLLAMFCIFTAALCASPWASISSKVCWWVGWLFLRIKAWQDLSLLFLIQSMCPRAVESYFCL